MNKTQMETEIRRLIRDLAPTGTKFRWSRANRQFGCCSYKCNRLTNEIYDMTIAISYPMAMNNTWEVVKQTVLHEIAHANTPGHHHDRVWQRECIRLGGDGKRCYTDTNNGGEVVVAPKKFVGTCPVCGSKFYRDRRTHGYHCNRYAPIRWANNVA